jgi:hypothetical protein
MPQMAEMFPTPGPSDTCSIEVPVSSVPVTGMPLSLPDSLSPVAASWLTYAATEVGAVCGRAKDYTTEALSGAREQARDLATRMRDRAEKVKNEQPLQVLAVAAGIAVAAGVVSRVWRSRRYE